MSTVTSLGTLVVSSYPGWKPYTMDERRTLLVTNNANNKSVVASRASLRLLRLFDDDNESTSSTSGDTDLSPRSSVSTDNNDNSRETRPHILAPDDNDDDYETGVERDGKIEEKDQFAVQLTKFAAKVLSETDDNECEQGDMCMIPLDDDEEGDYFFYQNTAYNNKVNGNSLGTTTTNNNGGDFTSIERRKHVQQIELNKRVSSYIETILAYLPIISPILAFFTYEHVAKLFSFVIELISFDRNWVAVDGGSYQAQIITPAINGIVLPAIAILFATLISNTVTTLRQRQLDVRTTLNMEAGELRILSAIVDSFPINGGSNSNNNNNQKELKNKDLSFHQDKCRAYLIHYTSRLVAESRGNVEVASLDFVGSLDSEMIGFLATLNEMTTELQSGDVAMSALLSESYGAVTRLNAERSTRISALQSTFPALHYAILTALAGSICVAFLIEGNQELLIFLNAIQLRILWTMLIGTFSALGVVCYDLSDPFRGSYQISDAVNQLYTIRNALRASDCMKRITTKKK